MEFILISLQMMQWLNYVDQKELNHSFRFNTDAKESLVVTLY